MRLDLTSARRLQHHILHRYTSLHCRSTALAHFSLGSGAAAGFPIFISENLQWPGFVEFDDVNSRVLTYNASTLTCVTPSFQFAMLTLSTGIACGTCARTRRSSGAVAFQSRSSWAQGRERVVLTAHARQPAAREGFFHNF